MKINQKLTDKIIKLINDNPKLTWQALYKKSNTLINAETGKKYRGGNEFLLLAQLMTSPYESGIFCTFKQAQKLNLKMIKGSKGFMINFFSFLYKDAENNSTTSAGEWLNKIPMVKTYTVFSLDCFEESEEKQAILTKYAPKLNDNQPIENVQKYIDSYLLNENIPVKLSPSLSPCYMSTSDSIGIPMLNQFDNSPAYYSVLFHEIAHSTGHEKRLNRKLGNKFGSEKYAREELIAELSAVQLCNAFGLDTVENSSAYLQSWLQPLKNDVSLLLTSASKASDVLTYITKSVDSHEAKQAKIA